MGYTAKSSNRGLFVGGDIMKDILVAILVALITVIVVGLILSVPVMLLWNWVVPDIFNLPQINLGQALGLSMLSCCLFNWGKTSSKK